MALTKCKECGGEVSSKAKACPHCGAVTTNRTASASPTRRMKQKLGLIGALVLFVGVFMPVLHVPIVGNINYFQNGKGDGTIILILALISSGLLIRGKFEALWYTGLSSIGVMGFTLINFQMKMSKVKAQMETDLADNPFRELADLTIDLVQFQWGWSVLVVGAVLLMASAAIKDDPRENYLLDKIDSMS